jgi:uncharacterized Zn finger protein (UPF0148 family)
MKMDEYGKPIQCCASVHRAHMFRPGRCERKATVERDGKFYCAVHDPVFVEKKRAHRRTELEVRMAKRERKFIEIAALRAMVKELAEALEYLGDGMKCFCHKEFRCRHGKLCAVCEARAVLAKAKKMKGEST